MYTSEALVSVRDILNRNPPTPFLPFNYKSVRLASPPFIPNFNFLDGKLSTHNTTHYQALSMKSNKLFT